MDRTTTTGRLLSGYWLLAVLIGLGSTSIASTWQSRESIRSAAEAAAIEASESSAKAVADSLDPRLRLVACSVPLTATVAANGVPSARLTAEVRCTGAQPWLLYLPVRMTSTRPLVVASRALARDTVLAPGDVRLANAPRGAVPAGALHDAGLAVGRLLRRPMNEGQAIVVPLLSAPAVVRRGQQVSVEAQTGSLKVTVAGVARRDGALGDTIEVESGTSGRIVEAVVRSAKSVEVLLR